MKPPKYVTPPFDVPGKFTFGVNYKVINFNDSNKLKSFWLLDDSYFKRFCLLKECAFLQDEDWIIVA